MEAAQCIWACRRGQDDLLKFRTRMRMRKKRSLSDFERTMVVGSRQAGLRMSETAGLLGFSCSTTSRVYGEWSEKEKKISSEWQFCGWKCLVDVRGEWTDWMEMTEKATVTQISTHYNPEPPVNAQAGCRKPLARLKKKKNHQRLRKKNHRILHWLLLCGWKMGPVSRTRR